MDILDIPGTLQGLLSAAPDLPIRRLPLRLEVSLASPTSSDSSDASLSDSQHSHSALRHRPAPEPPEGVWYVLALRALELRLAGAPDVLLAPQVLADRLQSHAYQLGVVRQVLGRKTPAAILADEVGLGKTIEAGLVLKELILRGSARTALIVAPKALLPQWQQELRERFDEEFTLSDEKRFSGFQHEERVICSFQQFVSAFEKIEQREWDCLIVDEAHLLANPDSKRRRHMAALRARWRLLLTATPVQNRITDLYSLIDLAVPGRLGTLRQFISAYVADPATCRAVVPTRAEELRAVAREVMCRTHRSETGIQFAPRRVETYLVRPEAPEAALVEDVTAYLRALYRRATDATPSASARNGRPSRRSGDERAGGSAGQPADAAPSSANATARRAHTPALNYGAVIREIVALQQSLSSSPQAMATALRARAEKHPEDRSLLLDLAARCGGVSSAKERLLLDALKALGRDQALVFTLRLETARRLRDTIQRTGCKAECYVGALGAQERQHLVERFNRGQLHTLIATDAGAEGLNLQQRCHVVFNYDLHWNPMKMEQRIGRVHRLGQTQEVLVANFALQDTIDEYVLRLLYEKINLFTMTIGALETVLADVQDGELDFEQRIVEALLRGEKQDDVRAGITTLGEQMDAARGRQTRSEALTAEVLG